MSVTSGSPTKTCWNRRSSAGSFSIRSRYSSRVVAPTIRSWPRASIGLSMLPASIAPSLPAPAPTTVCSSSMKVTTCPSLAWISASTALSRSSNSPRYLAPATMPDRSSETSRLPLSESGTSPATIRCASPSTTAVLPTPGSPMSTGLFLVRRLSTCTTRRISASRPMTGSSRPSRAWVVRSMPYFSSAWKVPSGSALSTLAAPRTCGRAARRASTVAPALRSRSPAGPRSAASASSRCSVDTYESPSEVISSCPAISTPWAARDSWGAATLVPLALGMPATTPLVRSSRLGAGTPTASSRPAGTPPGCATSAASRCTGSTCGLPFVVAPCTAAASASWLLVVSLSSIRPLLSGT